MRLRRRRIWLIAILLIICVWALFHTGGGGGEREKTALVGDAEIRVLMPEGNVEIWALEEFLKGVVAAEMPASFGLEALKAQAIAARTYVLSHTLAAGGIPRHDNADICCDSRHCQAYLALEQPEHYQQICRAVEETAGLVIYYEGALVETPYCSTCGGRTQSAAGVWGQEVAYLKSVACYWDAHSPRAYGKVELSLDEAARRLSVEPQALATMEAQYSVGGAISNLSVGGKNFSGQELRQVLGLDSASCQWLIENNRVLFTTRGFGHGVGLCQYGADGMAKAGYKADNILCHYYQGVEIKIRQSLNPAGEHSRKKE